MIWLYKLLLRLYPTAFYNQFADEMVDTFEALRHDQPSPLTDLRELLMLPVSIIREHHRSNTVWYMILLLMLPALLGCAVLLFRPLQRFYLSYNLWLLFAGAALTILLIGWRLERRMTVLALPSLGFMLFIALRIFSTPPAPGYYIPIWVWASAPFMLLIGVLVWLTISVGRSTQHRYNKFGWKTWLPYVIALPVTGLAISVSVIALNGVFGMSLPDLFVGYLLGGWLPMGMLALLFLAGLPFALRFGAAAVLLIVGYLFFDLLGLSATLPNLELQQLTAIWHALLFLLVIPLLALKLPRYRTLGVLVPIALAYGLILLIKFLLAETDATFLLYRLNELAQTLIALYVAMQVYAQLEQPTGAGGSLPATDSTVLS
jgi:hypothetical protein